MNVHPGIACVGLGCADLADAAISGFDVMAGQVVVNVHSSSCRRSFNPSMPVGWIATTRRCPGILYLYALVMLRLLGKRDVQQLTFFEFAIIIALGSAMGDPMFYPDVPLLHGAIVITVIVFVQRGISVLVERNETLTATIEGVLRLLVEDGIVNMPALEDERMPPEEVFSRLRTAGIRHLGQIERAWLEPTGDLGIWQLDCTQAPAGLPIMPKQDPHHPPIHRRHEQAPTTGPLACTACGRIRSFTHGAALGTCQCGSGEWTAVHESGQRVVG